jgi:hypothetical protein
MEEEQTRNLTGIETSSSRRIRIDPKILAVSAFFLFLVGIIVLTALNPSLSLDRTFDGGLILGIAMGILFSLGLLSRR